MFNPILKIVMMYYETEPTFVMAPVITNVNKNKQKLHSIGKPII